MKPWKAFKAFQNNGPDYAVITTGEWKSPAIATAPKLEDAQLIARAVNAHEELITALKVALEYQGARPRDVNEMHAFKSHATSVIEKALAKAEGKP